MEPSQLSARERIIDAATDIFGTHGFKAATLRAIANLAGVNVAAVNYYFGDKQGLYGEVVQGTGRRFCHRSLLYKRGREDRPRGAHHAGDPRSQRRR